MVEPDTDYRRLISTGFRFSPKRAIFIGNRDSLN